MRIKHILISTILLFQIGCAPTQESRNPGASDSTVQGSLTDKKQEELVSEYTGLNDGYDFNTDNPIDSVHIVCNLAMPFDVYIYKSGDGYSVDLFDHKEYVSEFFCRATLEDIDALFIQKVVPIELNRNKSEYLIDTLMSLSFEIYYNGIKKEEKIVFDSRYDVEYSVRFDNLIDRLNDIGEIIYERNYAIE